MSKALDQLFGLLPAADEVVAPPMATPPATKGNRFRDLPIDALVDMEQPFHMYGSEAMEDMRRSISAHGVLQRLIVRPYQDELYQIISGRNRRTGARLAGYTAVPCEIRDLDDEEAQLQMLEINLRQRDKLLPSEKAWAYRLRLEAMSSQGRRTDLTLVHDEQRPKGSVSRDLLAHEVSDSSTQIHRYIRLTYLIPELLALVDKGQLGLTISECLSFLSTMDQKVVFRYLLQEHPTYISQALAEAIRQASEEAPLTEQVLEELTSKPSHPAISSVSLPAKRLRRYFKPGDSREQIITTIEKALEAYLKSKS